MSKEKAQASKAKATSKKKQSPAPKGKKTAAKKPAKADTPKKASAKGKQAKAPAKGNKKAPKQSKKGAKSKQVTVDQHADTIFDPRPSHPPKEKGKKPQTQRRGWRWVDLILTTLLVLTLACVIGGVVLINKWSQNVGAKGLHPLSIEAIGERGRAYFSYLKLQFGPPHLHTPSLGYEKEIQASAIRYKVPANLIKAVIRVSASFHTQQMDRDGAIGLMAVTPRIAKELGEKGNLFHPDINIKAGTRFLQKRLKQTRHIKAALIAYHAMMRGKNIPKPNEPSIHRDFATQALKAYKNFHRDPGQEIRKASKHNRNAPSKKRKWLSWRKLKSLIKPKKDTD